jgi:hypothetical protein
MPLAVLYDPNVSNTSKQLLMKFMIANDGPMLSTVLKVFRLICPWLKAIIVKA